MNKARKLCIMLSLALAVSLVAGTSQASASVSPMTMPTSGLPPVPAVTTLDDARNLAVQSLYTLVQGQPSLYGALSSTSVGGWSPDHVVVHVVYAVDGIQHDVSAIPTPSVRSAAETVASDGVQVSVVYDPRSLQDLQKVMDTLTAHSASYVGMTRWGIDPKSNTVAIGLSSTSASVTQQSAPGPVVPATFVAFGDLVTISTDNRTESPSSSRYADFSPFWGGDRIAGPSPEFNGQTGVCTSGFGIVDGNGVQWTTTAGHCGVDNTGWYNDSPQQAWNAGTPIGNVHFDKYYNGLTKTGGMDVELINGYSYGADVWTNGLTSGTVAKVTSASDACVGCLVYADGAVVGQVTMLVESAPYCHSSGTSSYCAAADAQARNGTDSVCPGGSSGGPVFAPTAGGGVIAMGIIHGNFNSDNTCIYTSMPAILTAYNAHLATG